MPRKPDFYRSTVLATELLYEQDISDRFLDVTKFNYKRQIIFDSIQNYCTLTKQPLENFVRDEKSLLSEGCLIPINNINLILYNNKAQSAEHRNWTLAHEVGHVFLEHKKDGDIEEVEAHFFASQIFMPELTLLMMGRKHGQFSALDLVEIFGVSITSAQKRIHTYNKKTLFNASKKDYDIWERQEEKIDLYYKCKRDRIDFRYALEEHNCFCTLINNLALG